MDEIGKLFVGVIIGILFIILMCCIRRRSERVGDIGDIGDIGVV